MPQDQRELFCILVPLADGKLILPRAVVEEVRSLGEVQSLPDVPPWLVGNVRWNGAKIPLVAIESLIGQHVRERSRRSRMVVVRTPEGTLEPNVMAIHAQGFPYILRVTPELLTAGNSTEDEGMFTRVSLGLEQPVIPDLPALARHAARLLAA